MQGFLELYKASYAALIVPYILSVNTLGRVKELAVGQTF